MSEVKNSLVRGVVFPSAKGVKCLKVEKKSGILENGQPWENCTCFFNDLEGNVMQFKLKYGKSQPTQYAMLQRMEKGKSYVLGFEVDVNDVQQISFDLIDFAEV